MIKVGKSASNVSIYTCCPKNKEELEAIIKKRISKEGRKCDLNDIDTSKITNMTELFYFSKFNGDISKWNVSNVENMACMFMNSKFNNDISKWDVYNVKSMNAMFSNNRFNQDISNWNINKNCSAICMFENCPIKEEFKPESLQYKLI